MKELKIRFKMQLNDESLSPSKQELISAVCPGDSLILNYNFSTETLDVFLDSYRIGTVPNDVFPNFFKNGIMLDSEISAIGLVPVGRNLVSCEVFAVIYQDIPNTDINPAAGRTEKSSEIIEELKPPIETLIPPKRDAEVCPRIHKPPLKKLKELPVYRREWFIMLMLYIAAPIGLGLMFIFSRRRFLNKILLTSSLYLIISSVLFFPIFKSWFAQKSTPQNSPEPVVVDFLEDWKNENWQEIIRTADYQGEILNENTLSSVFKDKLSGDYSIKILDGNIKFENRTIFTITAESGFNATVDAVLSGGIWNLDLRSLSHELYQTPLEEFFKNPVRKEAGETLIVYIDTENLVYHKKKNCAPPNALENPVNEARMKGYDPCPRCARS